MNQNQLLTVLMTNMVGHNSDMKLKFNDLMDRPISHDKEAIREGVIH